MGTGPLDGTRIVEFAGLGPTPFAAMMLADMGADVVRIDRISEPEISAGDPRLDILNRSRSSLALDLKDPAALAEVSALCDDADVVVEGFRPGVMERLGLGPDLLRARNPRLVYARLTGWGQDGPLAQKAGHDINYIAISGALYPVGDPGAPPPPPLNLFGDFGGGAMFAVAGILAALVERQRSDEGQVVDVAMVDGSALLMAQIHSWRAMGFWSDARGANLLDGASYFYRCYQAADGGYLAVGAIEPRFHDAFIRGLGLPLKEFGDQMDRSLWPARGDRIAALMLTRTRAEWVAVFDPFDACVSPVLSPAEATQHPANQARKVFAHAAGVMQPTPAPRFARTPSAIQPFPSPPRGSRRAW